MPRSQLAEAIARFRADLTALDKRSVARLAAVYQQVIAELSGLLDAMTADMTARLAAGETLSPGWLFRQQRYRELIRQADALFTRFGALTGQTLTTAQQAAIRRAPQDASDLIRAAQGPPPPGVTAGFVRLPTGAMTDLVASFEPGSPVNDLLTSFGADAASTIKSELIRGMAVGRNPNLIAKAITTAMGGNLARAALIAHTETLRAYRSATLRTYQENAHLLKGWRWVAALSPRTCAACLAQHGTIHPLDEPFGSHPRCRCSAAPLTKSWRELGFDVPAHLDRMPTFRTGPDIFRDWSPEDQLAVLGPAKFAAYQAGEIDLPDLVAVRQSRVWGTTRAEASLDEAREKASRSPAERKSALPKRTWEVPSQRKIIPHDL